MALVVMQNVRWNYPGLLYHEIHAHSSLQQVHFPYIENYQVFLSAANTTVDATLLGHGLSGAAVLLGHFGGNGITPIVVPVKHRRLIGPNISLNWVNALAERFQDLARSTWPEV